MEIESTLRKYVREQCLPRSADAQFADERNLFESGVLDSAGLISFIGFIETEFDLKIPDEDLIPAHFMSIASIAEYIRSRRKVQQVAAPV